MDSYMASINENINAKLTEWQVCSRCRLRFMSKNIDYAYFRVDCEENWICYVCCGILQSSCIDSDKINEIKSFIIESEYNFNSFQVVVSTPINLFIREFSIYVALKETFPQECASFSLEEVVHIKSIWRYLIKDELSQSIGKAHINGKQVQDARLSNDCLVENDFLIVNISFSHEKDEFECNVLTELEPELYQKRRKGGSRYKWELFTRKGVEKLLLKTTSSKFQRHFAIPPNHKTKAASVVNMTIEVGRQDPVIVAGRYCKFSRRLPQSPWIFDGVRKLESSVDELISEKLVTAFRASSSGFVASGREDVDVRMLGDGRPFLIELKNCKNMVRDLIGDMGRLEGEINSMCDGRIKVNRLSVISKEFVNLIKKGEEEKSKRYRMVVWCEKGVGTDESELDVINAARDVVVQQLTPIRVLHRRSLMERPRTFYSFIATRLDRAMMENNQLDNKDDQQFLSDYSRFLDQYDPHHLFLLELRCQAGSYVKEFIHGDLGRTRPNLATIIGQQCDILALDVLEVDLQWPPVV